MIRTLRMVWPWPTVAARDLAPHVLEDRGLAGLRLGFVVAQPEAIGWPNRVSRALQRQSLRPGGAVVALGDP